MFNKIIKKYKNWFGDIRILIGLSVLIMIGFMQNRINGLIHEVIVILGASIIFPPLTIILDKLCKKN